MGVHYCLEQKEPFGTRMSTGEPIFAVLCQDCGSLRPYVKNLRRDWVRRDG